MEPNDASSTLRELFQHLLVAQQSPQIDTILTQLLSQTEPSSDLQKLAQESLKVFMRGFQEAATEDVPPKLAKESLKTFMRRHAARQDAKEKSSSPKLNEVTKQSCDSPTPTVNEKSVQDDSIRRSFVLAGVGDGAACGKFIAAIELRGSPVGKMSIEELSIILNFLHPELTLMSRAKLATILSVVL